MSLTLWHNPRCSKSQQALALLQARGLDPEIRRYLEDPPTVAELDTLRRKLDRPAIAFTRTQEPAFKASGLTADSPEAAILSAISEHPILLERPILVAGDKAQIGRPPEAVLGLF